MSRNPPKCEAEMTVRSWIDPDTVYFRHSIGPENEAAASESRECSRSYIEARATPTTKSIRAETKPVRSRFVNNAG
jgi:hypothetical protein